MRRQWVGMLFVLALLVLGLSASGAAAEEIAWLITDYPPYSILNGDLKGQGIADAAMHVLMAHLTQWTHREEVADPTAIMVRLGANEHSCSIPFIRTPERERVFTFSVPALLAPPLGITIRREQLARFGGGAPVSLTKLLDDRQLRLGVAQGRSYGAVLDAELAKHKGQPNLYRRAGNDIYRGLFGMLVSGRVDYILGLPQEALYLARESGVEDRVTSLRLTDSTDYVVGHVVCPNSDWGRQVIAAIDRVLVAERPKVSYRASLERWVDARSKTEFRRQYDKKLRAQ